MQWKKIFGYFDAMSKDMYARAKEFPQNRFKATAYKNIYNIITDTFAGGKKVADADVLALNISDGMKGKIIYFAAHPKIFSIEMKKMKKMKKNDVKKNIVVELSGIMGIGLAKARELADAGVKNKRDLSKVKYKSMLTEQTKIYLALKPLVKIPRAAIDKLAPILAKITSASSPSTNAMIVGSYRRGKNFSRDVDVAVVSNNKKILSVVLEKLKKMLGKENIFVYVDGPDKVSTIIKVDSVSARPIKMDLFRVPPSEKWAQILYSTGSKANNIKMRNRAKKMGLLLNQHGLYKGKKLLSTPDKAKSEKWFFKQLDMEYKSPGLR